MASPRGLNSLGSWTAAFPWMSEMRFTTSNLVFVAACAGAVRVVLKTTAPAQSVMMRSRIRASLLALVAGDTWGTQVRFSNGQKYWPRTSIGRFPGELRYMEVLGIDIGGSGIKGAPVDTASGRLTEERLRIPTPQPAKPREVAEVVVEIVKHFDWTGQVGVTFPGVVVDGVIMPAANADHSWIGVDARKLFDGATVLNDADAAGVAEMRFGE